MDNKSLVKITNSRSLAANKGFRESWNFVVEFFRLLSEGMGIEFHWSGARLVIDASQPTNAGGEASREKPIWEQDGVCFRVTPNDDGSVFTVSNCVVFLEKMRVLHDFTISGSGYTWVEIRRSPDGTFAPSITSSDSADPNAIDGAREHNDTQKTYYPLFQFGRDSDGRLEMWADYVHTMPNLYYMKFGALFQANGPRAVKRVTWDADEGALKTTSYVNLSMWVPKVDNYSPPLGTDTVVVAEDYSEE